jgi:DNA topoisomerase-1
LVLRHGRYGEFVSCSGYPECKWVKQNYIGMKCPDCKEGELVEKKARRGNFFYGCSEYPKCHFTAATRPVAETCPDCGSPYLLEKTTKEGTFLVCPNSKASAPAKGKGKGKKKAAEPEALPTCQYTRLVAPPPAEEKATA